MQQALQSVEWKQAMKLELDALSWNNTWTLVLIPSNHRVIGCKWVYKLKFKPNGSIERHKAHLVAKGFHQMHNLDYFETFSLVVKFAMIRFVLILALSHDDL